MDLERHDLRQIEQLNQRGGRTLSIMDLIQAGTISVHMAAYAMRELAGGASLLTGARPGGAGKSTLLGAILGLLPSGVPIVTVDGSRAIQEARARPASEPTSYAAHEIGSRHWYGYIWGRNVAEFFSLIDGQRRIASCLRADTLEELAGIPGGLPLQVAQKRCGGSAQFIHTMPGPDARRRVASLLEADGCGGTLGPLPQRAVACGSGASLANRTTEQCVRDYRPLSIRLGERDWGDTKSALNLHLPAPALLLSIRCLTNCRIRNLGGDQPIMAVLTPQAAVYG